MSVTIREASSSELRAVLDLYADLENKDIQPFSPAEAERIYARMKLYPNYTLYVAEIENEIVGTFALLILDNLAHGGAPSGIVEDVVVHAQRRGHGIGKAMMQFAMDQCAKAGCYKLALSSSLIRHPAHDFYRSLGFQQHGYSFLVELGR
jgi:GNAT superfamily N-acetyltransferase